MYGVNYYAHPGRSQCGKQQYSSFRQGAEVGSAADSAAALVEPVKAFYILKKSVHIGIIHSFLPSLGFDRVLYKLSRGISE